jgi:TonB family protein
MRILFPAAALAVLGAPALAAPVSVAPTAKWVVDFDDAQCVASLAYGREQLFLKASPLGDVVQLGIMEPGRTGPPQQVEAKITPAVGESFIGTAMQWTSATGGPRQMRLINMPAAEFQRLAASPSLAFQLGEMKRHYAMSAMAAMTKVMKTCVDDLQQVWSSEGGVGAKAVANLASYFSDNDYPEDAIYRGLSGTTGLALLINEEGKVADCMVVQTSGQAGLDTQSCAIIKRRARFTPARGIDGKPTKDRVTSRISWRIP